jgi:hypothetical protein
MFATTRLASSRVIDLVIDADGMGGVWTYGDLVAMAICVQQSMTCVHEKREGEGGGDLPTHRRVQKRGDNGSVIPRPKGEPHK